MEWRSPLKDAIDWVGVSDAVSVALPGTTLRNEDQEPLFWGDTPAPSPLLSRDMINGVMVELRSYLKWEKRLCLGRDRLVEKKWRGRNKAAISSATEASKRVIGP